MQRIIFIMGILFTLTCQNKQPLVFVKSTKVIYYSSFIALNIKNYQSQPGFTFQNIFVKNMSYIPSTGVLNYSESKSGLLDSDMQLLSQQGYLISQNSFYPSEQNFSNFTSYLLGLRNDSSIPDCNVLGADSLEYSMDTIIYSKDAQSCGVIGMNKCEKKTLNAFKDLSDLPPIPMENRSEANCSTYKMNANFAFDFYSTNIPDLLKMLCKIPFLGLRDGSIATGMDGVENINKCKFGIPIDENFYDPLNQQIALQYTVTHNLSNTDQLDFTVSNIPLVKDQDNLIVIYLLENSNNPNLPQAALSSAYFFVKNTQQSTYQTNYWGCENPPCDSALFLTNVNLTNQLKAY